MKNQFEKFSILIPENKDELIEFAVNELQEFTHEICDFIPGIVKSEPCGKFIALGIKNKGNSPLLKKIDELSDDGYIIVTENGNYYIYGCSSYGVVFGVYALLNKLCNLEFYSYKDYSFDKWQYKDVNLIDNPNIPLRALGIMPYHDETLNGPPMKENLRMKFHRMTDGWGICNHSYFKILPPSIYKEKHPDWYSKGDNGINLCLTNSEMQVEFVERMKEIVLSNPESTYFMIGQEDTTTICCCENCCKALEKANHNDSVLMINFTNSVVKKLNEWAKNIIPKRKIIYCMFAYHQTILPPVKEENGQLISLLNYKVEDNLAVMLAPVGSSSSYSYFDERNHLSMDKKFITDKKVSINYLAKGWNKIVNKLFFWSYSIDNVDWLVPFDMWDVMEENFKNYVKYNVYYLFEEGSYHTTIPNFNGLRVYLFSNIMWNINVSIKNLIKKYFDFYFGKYADEMYKIFTLTHKYIANRAKMNNRLMFYVKFDDFENLGTREYIEYDFLIKLKNMYDNLIKRADEPYKMRIYEESLSVNYLLFLLYRDELDDKTYESARKTTLEIATKYNMFKNLEGLEYLYNLKDILKIQRQ